MLKVKYNNELLHHKLKCGWCDKNVSLKDVMLTHKVSKKSRFMYVCEHCSMRSEVKQGVKGFYSLYSYNKNRYFTSRKAS